MKTITFIILMIACYAIIPAAWINAFVVHIPISGDGEEAMNNYEFTGILIRFFLSAGIAGLIMFLYRTLKR
jgi:hypothetical protein